MDQRALDTLVIPAESSRYVGAEVATALSGYTGIGYVVGFARDGDYLEMDVPIEQAGFYALTIRHTALDGAKRNGIYVDGDFYGDLVSRPGTTFTASQIGVIQLGPGTHTVRIQKSWGGIAVDGATLTATTRPPHLESDFTLTQANASAQCLRLMGYLQQIYGRRILTGQHTSAASGPEILDIQRLTGKRPALRGFDFLSYSCATETEAMLEDCRKEIANNRGSVEEAITWFQEHGGIVTFCWHWFAPTGGVDKTFYTKNTPFDLAFALAPGSPEHVALMADIDEIGRQLTRLRDAGVPVLWRPLHEADGGWFWWGAKGAEPFKQLWRLLYTRYTEHFQLNNLIWVFNAPDRDWYPGDDCVDLVGMDIYGPAENYGPLKYAFDQAVGLTDGRKPVALTENGVIPDPDKLLATHSAWLWYMPWWGGGSTFGKSNSETHVKSVYDHPYTITLDELPSWTS